MENILIKAPPNELDMVLSLPFMHMLKANFPNAKFRIILNEGSDNIYQYLFFPIEVYYFPTEKNTLPGIHHYCVNNLDVFNVDYYFDLESSFKSAFMGFAFRSEKRIGYKNGLNQIFLTHVIHRKEFERYQDNSESYVRLLQEIDVVQSENLIIMGSRNSNECSKWDEPYVILYFEDFKNYENKEQLAQFLNSFVGQLFVFAYDATTKSGGGEAGKVKKEIEAYVVELTEHNKYVLEPFDSHDKFVSLIINSKGLLTNSLWRAALAAYFATDSISLCSGQLSVPPCKFFKKSPLVAVLNKQTIQINMDGGRNTLSSMEAFVEFVHKFLSL